MKRIQIVSALIALVVLVIGVIALQAILSMRAPNEPPVALGQLVVDTLPLADAAHLQYLAAPLNDAQGLRVQDLFADGLSFARAPDPSELLARTAASNPDLEAEGSIERLPYSILTWNVALLDYWIGPKRYAFSPAMEERKPVIIEQLNRIPHDVLMLQEVWLDSDRKRFIAELSEHYVTTEVKTGFAHGLMVFVHRDRLTNQESKPVVELRAYGVQDKLERLGIPGKTPLQRSYLHLQYGDKELGTVHLLNTHMQAFPKHWKNRMHQARELGAKVAELPADELVFVAGDMNAGPYYLHDTWTRPDGEVDSNWWANAMSYGLLLQYGGLVDLAIRGRSSDAVYLDVNEGRRVRNDGTKADCNTEHKAAFTATDCNQLYEQQYGGTEAPARLDHILARDSDARIAVTSSRHVYVNRPVSTADGPVEASDHYAVEVVLMIEP